MSIRLEEITLLVAVEVYKGTDIKTHGIDGIDYVVDILEEHLPIECKLLEYSKKDLTIGGREKSIV